MPLHGVQEASRKHSVNGYTFCNMPEVRVRQGARLRLLLIGIGSETGMHTPGFTDLVQHTPSGASYVVELYPGMAKVVGMYAGVQACHANRGFRVSVRFRGCALKTPLLVNLEASQKRVVMRGLSTYKLSTFKHTAWQPPRLIPCICMQTW